MESYSIVIVLLAVSIGLSPVAARMKLPYPILLLAAGIVVGASEQAIPIRMGYRCIHPERFGIYTDWHGISSYIA